MTQYQITHTPDAQRRKWHALVRDDGSVSFFYTKEGKAGQFVVYDSIDNQNAGDLRAENERLREENKALLDAGAAMYHLIDMMKPSVLALYRVFHEQNHVPGLGA